MNRRGLDGVSNAEYTLRVKRRDGVPSSVSVPTLSFSQPYGYIDPLANIDLSAFDLVVQGSSRDTGNGG